MGAPQQGPVEAEHCPRRGWARVSVHPSEALPLCSGCTRPPAAPATLFLFSVGRQEQLCTAFLSGRVSPS